MLAWSGRIVTFTTQEYKKNVIRNLLYLELQFFLPAFELSTNLPGRVKTLSLELRLEQ